MFACAAGYWCNVIRIGSDDTLSESTGFISAIVNHGAFAAGAWVMIAYYAWQPASQRRPGAAFIAAALGCALLCLAAARLPTSIALAGLSLLWLRPPRSRNSVIVAVLLAALAAELSWGSSMVTPLHLLCAQIDAANAARLLRLLGFSVSVDSTRVMNLGNGFDIDVWGPCASSYSLASVVLAYIVTSIFCGRLPGRRDVGWIGGAMLASAALNTMRLAWMAVAPEDYAWLHEGNGSAGYALLAVVLAVLFPVLAATIPERTHPAPCV